MSENNKEKLDTRGAEATNMASLHLLIELTDFCNQRCIMCKHHYSETMHSNLKKQFMEFELFQRIVEDLKRGSLKVYSIDPLWAGESMMHPRFVEMMRYLFEENKKHDFFRGFVLNTNASLMTREVVDLFLDFGSYLKTKETHSFQLILSLEAFSPDAYAKIRNVPPQTLAKVAKNIEYLLKERSRRKLSLPNLVFGFIVMEENQKEAGDFLKFWKKRLKKYSNCPFDVVPTWPTTTGRDAIYFRRLICEKTAEANALHRKVAERLGIVPKEKMIKKRPIKPLVRPSGRRPCGAPWRTPNITACGIVTPCCRDIDLHLSLGDIHEASLSEIWHGEKVTALRMAHVRGDLRDFPMCLHCLEPEGGAPSDEEIVGYLMSVGAEADVEPYLSRWAKASDEKVEAIPEKEAICLVSREYPPETGWGGIGSYTYDLAHGLAEKGYQVHVVAQGLEKDQEYWDGSVHVHRIFHRTIFRPKGRLLEFLCRLEYSWWLYKKLEEIIEQYSIEVVEVPNFFAEGFFFSLFKKIPLVTRLHSSFSEVIKAYGWGDTFDRRLSCWLEDAVTLRSDLVTSSTHVCLQRMVNFLSLDPKKVAVIPLGIPMPTAEHVIEKGMAGGAQDLNVLFLGRLERRKGVHVLMRAIPIVLEKIPRVNFTIVGRDTFVNEQYSAFNGSREESFKETLLKDFPEKFKAQVTFEGHVEKDKLPCYFQKCDVFVAPSLYESFGLIYIEAMGYGRPVIGCAVGGIPEVIRDGETGLLVPPEDPAALADAIIRLLRDSQARAEMGKKARVQATENFTRELMVQKTIEAYEKVMQKK